MGKIKKTVGKTKRDYLDKEVTPYEKRSRDPYFTLSLFITIPVVTYRCLLLLTYCYYLWLLIIVRYYLLSITVFPRGPRAETTVPTVQQEVRDFGEGLDLAEGPGPPASRAVRV